MSISLIYRLLVNLQANPCEFGTGVLSDNAGIATNLDLVGGRADCSIEDDDLLRRACNSCCELSIGGYSGSGSTCSSSCTAI